MKKKILLVLLVIIGLFTIVGCGNSENKFSYGKSYNVNGINVRLDKEDKQDGMKYKTSSFFAKDYKASSTSYTIYKDENGDKYDLSNVTFRIDVTADIMNSESRINREKALVKTKDIFENIEEDEKIVNGVTWEYFSFNNIYDKDNSFKEHLYITERKVDNYYYVYKIYFSYADDIKEFEDAFMNNVSFE